MRKMGKDSNSIAPQFTTFCLSHHIHLVSLVHIFHSLPQRTTVFVKLSNTNTSCKLHKTITTKKMVQRGRKYHSCFMLCRFYWQSCGWTCEMHTNPCDWDRQFCKLNWAREKVALWKQRFQGFDSKQLAAPHTRAHRKLHCLKPANFKLSPVSPSSQLNKALPLSESSLRAWTSFLERAASIEVTHAAMFSITLFSNNNWGTEQN